jgi:hypothetical protein
MLECCVVGCDFSRCSIARRSSLLSVAASGTSRITSGGVANNGTISGDALLIGINRAQATTAPIIC